jgi:hypothetical protein
MLTLVLVLVAAQSPASRIELVRAPSGGIQPRAMVDEQGTLHVVAFHGAEGGGELEYVRSSDGGKTFGAPLAVSSVPKSAVAIGNVRGAGIALGRRGRIHVLWNGAGSDHAKAPLLYARLDDAGTAFEPARDLAGAHHGLDGGSAVAADAAGNVWLVWHAPDGAEGEANRRVFVARSRDDGATFEPEVAVGDEGTGVCPCCGLGAIAGADGALAILYRTARNGDERDTTMLLADESGGPFLARKLDEWRVASCVMSTYSLARGAHGLLGAFESAGQIRFAPLSATAAAPEDAPGAPSSRKHPSLASGADGSVLLAWIEGMSWGRGGTLAWQLFGPDGKPIAGEHGRRDGVPAWSLVQAVALPGDRYVVLY